jgi:hypothetical protein
LALSNKVLYAHKYKNAIGKTLILCLENPDFPKRKRAVKDKWRKKIYQAQIDLFLWYVTRYVLGVGYNRKAEGRR